MRIITFLFINSLLLITQFARAGAMNDDPLLTYFRADQLELRKSDEEKLLVWEIDAWLGKDLNKFWIKSSGEHLDGETESNEIDLLYSKAISAFWDVQLGYRHEFKPEPAQDWVGFGFMGVAPYLFEVDLSLFINEDSLVNVRIEAEYEYMFTQKLILVPSLEVSIFSDDDVDRGVGSGIANTELGLRLHYEIKREFSPYIGINYERKFGKTADIAENDGGEVDDTQFVFGLSFWF